MDLHDIDFNGFVNLCQYVFFNMKYLINRIDIKYQFMLFYIINFYRGFR